MNVVRVKQSELHHSLLCVAAVLLLSCMIGRYEEFGGSGAWHNGDHSRKPCLSWGLAAWSAGCAHCGANPRRIKLDPPAVGDAFAYDNFTQAHLLPLHPRSTANTQSSNPLSAAHKPSHYSLTINALHASHFFTPTTKKTGTQRRNMSAEASAETAGSSLESRITRDEPVAESSTVEEAQGDGAPSQMGGSGALNEPEYDVDVKLSDLQASPDNPLFSVKSFEELNLYAFLICSWS